MEAINFSKVDKDCNRAHWYFFLVNGILNLLRFFLPILVITRMFGSNKKTEVSDSLYESIIERIPPKEDSVQYIQTRGRE